LDTDTKKFVLTIYSHLSKEVLIFFLILNNDVIYHINDIFNHK
jgi:hypothetical protein